jgi:O-acetyl-ADP-ribose deacetylase (regulator of RNase III)
MSNHDSTSSEGTRFGRTVVSVHVGELVNQAVDTIIVAGNQRAMIGAGANSTLWTAAGEDVERELREQAPFEIGTAVSTSSGRLVASGIRTIVHAIIAPGLGERPRQLAVPRAFEAALDVAVSGRSRSIAFPLLGVAETATPERRQEQATILIDVLTAVLRTRKHRFESAMLITRFDDDKRPLSEVIERARERLWTT